MSADRKILSLSWSLSVITPGLRLGAALFCLLTTVGAKSASGQHLAQPGNVVYSPISFFFAPDGVLFVSNFASPTVSIFTTKGRFVGSISTAGTGQWRIAANKHSGVYTDEGNNVSVYSASGQRLRVITGGFGNALGVTPSEKLISVGNGPAQVFNKAGDMLFSYIRDAQGLAFAGGSLAIWGNTLYYVTGPVAGDSILVKYSLEKFTSGVASEETRFINHGAYNPTQIASDSRGNIYVVGYADTQGRGDNNVTKIDRSGHVTLRLRNLAFPYGVALDKMGNIYVSEHDANDVKVFNSSGHLINTIR